jgi:hypothetical protein
MLLTEEEIVAQLDAQHTQRTANPALVGTTIQDDQDARVAAANATHTAITANTFTSLNTEDIAPASGNIVAKRYTGVNVITAIGDATIHEAAVRAALDADELFTHGGPYTDDYSVPSPYVDALTLIEGQKLTGENMF